MLVVCAAAACGNKTEPSPAVAPSTESARCSRTLELSDSVVDLSAKQIRLTVTTAASCQWTIATPSWVWVVSQYSGSGTYANGVGTGNVEVFLQVTAATSARDGEIRVLDSTVHLYQEELCAFKPTNRQPLEFGEAGGRASVPLSISPACEWSFDMPAWIRVEPASGSGSATLTIDVAPTDSPRAGLIATAGRSYGVRQTPAGMAPVLAFQALSCGTIRPGEKKVNLCYFEVWPAANPTSTQITLGVDKRPLGGSNYPSISPDLSTLGLGFSVDMGATPDVLPGLKAIPLTARDAQGRTATATALVSVMPPK